MRGLGLALGMAGLVASGGCVRRGESPSPSNALVAARPYWVVAPKDARAGERLPVVLLLHGHGGTSEGIQRMYGLDALVDSERFLLALPDGTYQHFGGAERRYWNATDACCAFNPKPVDDVAYFDALLDDLAGHYAVDPKRVYMVGLSNGGFMANRYACDRANRVAAIVSQAGAMWADASRCRPSEPVAMLQIHGTADRMVYYEGGRLRGDGPVVPSARSTVETWARLDECAATPEQVGPARDLTRDESPNVGAETTTLRWSGCRGVELWTLAGAAHVSTPNQPTWAQAVWGFLAAHPKP